MRCETMRDKIMAGLLDNELSASEKARVDGHLADCEACRELVIVMQKLEADVMAASLPIAAPERVWAKVQACIENPPPSMIETLREWFANVVQGFSPAVGFGSLAAGFMVLVLIVVPMNMQRDRQMAAADQETVMALVAADSTGSSIEDIGEGTCLECLL